MEAWNAEVARAVWPGPGLGAALNPAYEASLAFPNEGYRLDAEHMTALLQRLRGVTLHGPALAHAPRPEDVAAAHDGGYAPNPPLTAAASAAAPGAAAAASTGASAAPPVPRKRRRGGTYGGTWAWKPKP